MPCFSSCSSSREAALLSPSYRCRLTEPTVQEPIDSWPGGRVTKAAPPNVGRIDVAPRADLPENPGGHRAAPATHILQLVNLRAKERNFPWTGCCCCGWHQTAVMGWREKKMPLCYYFAFCICLTFCLFDIVYRRQTADFMDLRKWAHFASLTMPPSGIYGYLKVPRGVFVNKHFFALPVSRCEDPLWRGNGVFSPPHKEYIEPCDTPAIFIMPHLPWQVIYYRPVLWQMLSLIYKDVNRPRCLNLIFESCSDIKYIRSSIEN